MTTSIHQPTRHSVPTLVSELFKVFTVFLLLPLVVLVICGYMLPALVALLLMLILLSISLSSKHVVTFNFEHRSIDIITYLCGVLVGHRTYEFPDVRDVVYSADPDVGLGQIGLVLADGHKFEIQPALAVDCKEFYFFLRKCILHENRHGK
jgi:hypothetical protein